MLRLKNKKLLRLLVLCFAICLVTVLSFGNTFVSSASGKKVIKIGVNDVLSGTGAQYGQRNLEGLRLAIDEINQKGGINGAKIELLVFDNKFDKAEALNIATRLATKEKVLAIVGLSTSGTAKSASLAAEKYKVPLITGNAVAETVTVDERTGKTKKYVFRICFSSSIEGALISKFTISSLKLKNVAIVYNASNDYSKEVTKGFEEAFTKAGGKVVMKEAFSQGEQDFRSILTKIKAKNPQAIITPVYYDEAGLIIKQARELKINVPIIGGDALDDPKTVETAGREYCNNVYFVTFYSSQSPDKEVQDFVKRYKERYKVEPNSIAALGYVSGKFLIDAIKRANTISDREKLREALEKTTNYRSIAGTISIDSKHNGQHSGVVIEIQNGVMKFKGRITP